MAARVVCIALLIYRVSAGNVTTSLILPDGLFWGYPASQSFVGQSTVIGSVTAYTIDCGSQDTNFWPGPYGCDSNNSYTFSAAHATTRFLIPNADLGQHPMSNTQPVATWLQNFTQNITINCQTTVSSAANCKSTWLYNNEDADDKSMISSTIITTLPTETATSLYTFTFTIPGAALAGAAPSNAVASPTKNPPNSTATLPPINISSSTSPTSHPTTTPPPSSLSPGAKAGIGIGVSLGILSLSALAFLLYRVRRKHNPHSRLNAHGGFLPPGTFASEIESKNENENVVADTSGVHEMEGRRTPENGAFGSGVHEMEGERTPEASASDRLHEMQGS